MSQTGIMTKYGRLSCTDDSSIGAFLIMFIVITFNVALAKRKMAKSKRYLTFYLAALLALTAVRTREGNSNHRIGRL